MNRKHYGCKVEGCELQHRRNGYCAKHSLRAIAGTLTEVKEEKFCSVEECGGKYYSKGYCAAHYQRVKKAERLGKDISETLEEKVKTLGIKNCSVEGCKNGHHSKGFCAAHYVAYRKIENNYKENNEYSKGNLTFEYADRTNWSLSIKQVFEDKCMICDWNEAPCDVHHIIPVNEGGKNLLQNGIVLCCNHHKLADMGKLSREYLSELNHKAIELKNQAVELQGDIQ